LEDDDRSRDTRVLRQRAALVTNVDERRAINHDIERIIGEGQCQCITFYEFNGRIARTGQVEHRL
jgi:hypothetical protein